METLLKDYTTEMKPTKNSFLIHMITSEMKRMNEQRNHIQHHLDEVNKVIESLEKAKCLYIII